MSQNRFREYIKYFVHRSKLHTFNQHPRHCYNAIGEKTAKKTRKVSKISSFSYFVVIRKIAIIYVIRAFGFLVTAGVMTLTFSTIGQVT